MRALRFHTYGDPSVLRVEDVPRPAPRGDEVLIRVVGSSVNPAEVGGRSGHMRLIHARHLPMIPGYDVAGVVAECGPRVTAFVPGERVFALVGLGGGAQAEYVSVTQAKVAPAPARLSLHEAGAVPLAGLTALQALRGKGNIRAGQRVLINGASGGVGTFAVQIAKAIGCSVTAVCRAAKRAMVASLGADEVIDYQLEDFADRGQTWDVIFDAAGNRRFRDSWRALRPNGVMVASRAEPAGMLPAALGRFGVGPRYTFLITQPSGADLALLGRMIDQGSVRPVIDRVFALDEMQEAHRYYEAGRTQGKVVVRVAEDTTEP